MSERRWYGETLPLFSDMPHYIKEQTSVPSRTKVSTLEDELRALRAYMRKRDKDALYGWHGHRPHGKTADGHWVCLGTGPNTLRK